MDRGGKAAGAWRGAAAPARLLRFGLPLLLALGIAAKPPEISPPAPQERAYRVKGVGLSIRPFKDTTYLKFESGVSVSGEGFSLSAGVVELEIASGAFATVEDLKLPEGGLSKEELGRDPGEVAQRMSRELELPQASFNRSAIKRLSASGGVRVTTPEVTLSTDALLSIDGGQSWSTSGRAQLSRSSGSGARAENYSLAADHLLYDTQGKRAAAEGNIEASFKRGGQDPVRLSAEKLELHIEQGRLKVSGGLKASYGQISLVCREMEALLEEATLRADGAKPGEPGPLLTDAQRGLSLQAGEITVDLDDETVEAVGGVKLDDSTRRISLEASRIEGSLKKQTFLLSGKVSAHDSGHDLALTAERISADIAAGSYEASGGPVVRQGESTFTGERITVTQEKVPGQKELRTVVEVHGEQEARIDMDKPPKLPEDPR
ncbi:hypothetical protein IT575_11615 [bacterium]|nr:hypothetical protein [bacterium]